MRRLCLAFVIAGAGCASAPIAPTDLRALSRADARVLDGCYDCLTDARATYERIGIGKARALVVARLFETNLLLALREKELALDPQASLLRARALTGAMPAPADALHVLDLVDAVVPDDTGTTDREMRDFLSTHRELLPRIDDEIRWIAASTLSEPTRQYLQAALNCSYPIRPHRKPQTTVDDSLLAWPVTELPRASPPDAPPLVRYRVAICGRISAPALREVRSNVPQFVETSYFLGHVALGTAKDVGPGPARPLLDEVHAHFPLSPAVAYLTGNFNQVTGDCKAAVHDYDETLALKPAHERALLGRTACLTYLKQTDEAIAAATHMIEIGANVPDAYYWRAWNLRVLNDLDHARSDIEEAKRRGPTADIARLAGEIELDQSDLDPAERDFLFAEQAPGGGQDCESRWYLAVVGMKRERWIDSADGFVEAMSCYEMHAAEDEAKVSELKHRTGLDPAFQASQIAGFGIALRDDRSQQYASAFNAANHYAHGGSYANAKRYVELAAADPALADRVKELRQILKDKTAALAGSVTRF